MTLNRSSLTFQLGVALVLVCLFHIILCEDDSLRRQKRGFRLNSQSRVAHGYGKRGGFLRDSSTLQKANFPLRLSQDDQGAFLQDTDDGRGIMSVDDFVELLTNHPNLAKALLRKFVDRDGDDVISTEELFRTGLSK